MYSCIYVYRGKVRKLSVHLIALKIYKNSFCPSNCIATFKVFLVSFVSLSVKTEYSEYHASNLSMLKSISFNSNTIHKIPCWISFALSLIFRDSILDFWPFSVIIYSLSFVKINIYAYDLCIPWFQYVSNCLYQIYCVNQFIVV